MDQQKYILLYVYPNKEFYLDFYDRGGRGGDAGAVKGEFVILSRWPLKLECNSTFWFSFFLFSTVLITVSRRKIVVKDATTAEAE